MRATGEAPVADGRVEADALSVEGEFPVGWRERGYDFVATTAATEMHHRGELDRDVKDSRFQLLGNGIYEAVGKALTGHGARSSLSMAFPSTV